MSARSVEGKVVQQGQGGVAACDQSAEQLRGEEAEGDAIAAISLGGADARMAGYRSDQRQAIAGGVEGAGPTEFDIQIGSRPRRRQFVNRRGL